MLVSRTTVTALGTPGMATSSLPSSPVVVGKKYVDRCMVQGNPNVIFQVC